MFAGTGMVWENPTCGLPVLNPIHKSTATLFAVTRYSDLLKNQGDEDEAKAEHGQLFVTNRAGWWNNMVR